jgi:hypothetical protein
VGMQPDASGAAFNLGAPEKGAPRLRSVLLP